ncbi:unnamed protein product [Diamesa tonsa]
MDEPELVMQILERFSKLKQNDRDIPRELEEYITFVARTGDSVYHWALVKHLFREKLINVITQFYNDSPNIKELPQYPNVDAFNFETMKKMLIEKLDSFNSAPFTIQRICELLADPRKQYSRIDKFMRAVEKTILVVSTQEPGRHRSESENGDSLDSALNGDFASEVNVEIDMDSENSFSTKDFSATTTATANRKDTNNEVTTTTTKPTTALATDVTVATVKAPETNGSSEKTTDAVPKTDGEEVKSEPATEATPPAEVPPVTEAAPAIEVTPPVEAAPLTEAAPASEVVPTAEVVPVAEVTSVTATDSEESKPSSSNSDTEVKKDEDKSPVEEKAEEKPVVEAEEVRVEVAEEEEPESIEEELPEEAEEDEEDDEDDDDDDIANVGLVKLEDFAQTSTRIITEDTTASDSPDESDSGIKRMKYTVSNICTPEERAAARAEARNSSTTSTVVREEQQPQVGSTTTNTEDDEDDEDEEEEDKSQDSMSTSDAIPSTTEALEPTAVVEANPMNEEVPVECAEAAAVAVASLPSSSIVLEMEASSSAEPSAPVESKMSLDEDATSEITEESAPVVPINKMDTETEGDAMDVDESEATSEPMDQ